MANNELDTSGLNSSRFLKASKEKEIFLDNERKRKLREDQTRLKRYRHPENSEQNQQFQEIEKQIASIDDAILSKNKELTAITARLDREWLQFAEFTDPKLHINRLDEKYPILLMPLRIETRFKKVTSITGASIDQLWVRVYPDVCFVDTFEETLSESEIRDAQSFWMDWWIAAGDEALRRAAWKYLVDGHGHGRAQYIINAYQPNNYDEILHSGEEITTPTVYLVINGYPDILETEKASLTDYWISIYQAQGDLNSINVAANNLIGALGEVRATILINNYPPKNIKVSPPAVTGDGVLKAEVKYIEFEPATDSQKETWSQAPKVTIMPECLYLLGYVGDNPVIEQKSNTIPFPLIVGPNPKMSEDELFDIPGTDIKITRDMRWMVDFDFAVDNGMGFKVNLSSEQAIRGFDKLFVLGVKMSSTRNEGRVEFENLIKHHYFGNSGFGFLPVGTPTNNTLNSPSGYSNADDSDESFDLVFNPSASDDEGSGEGTTEKEWWGKSDRKWFCEMLGIAESTFENTINTDGYDQAEVRAMNIALWPATWGYFFETMLKDTLNDNQIENIRWYFNNFVVGRGTIPSIRIDDQPYGILPTTAFSRMGWLNEKLFIIPNDIANHIPTGLQRFLPLLNSKLSIIQSDWMRMLNNVSYVGKSGDPHQLLMDILGLHGGSVEFYNRIGESFEHIYNLYLIAQKNQSAFSKIFAAKKTKKSNTSNGVTIEDVLEAIGNTIGGRLLLNQLGYTGKEDPEILEKLFVLNAEKLTGPLIDDLPLSEINPIRVYSNGNNGTTPENYIQWLIRVAKDSFDKLRKEEGFIDSKSPNALLYLMLKYALEQSFFVAGLNLYRVNEVLSREMINLAKIEPNFIHVRNATVNLSNAQAVASEGQSATKPLDVPFASESRYNLLYQKQPAITGSPDMMVAEFIPAALKEKHFATRYLYEQTQALKLLVESPTARLERAFVEHIDCASYRLDAWKFGVVNYQLKSLRNRIQTSPENPDGTDPANDINKGLYLGAYGWLENVKSENKVLKAKVLSKELVDIFKPTIQHPIQTDSKNLGYINAPSLNHAVTAAILRNGYEAYANEANANIFNINLSSDRVRKALTVIEGIQNGQSLAALLGYQFERGIHDNNKAQNVDHFVFKIRRKFPLVSNQILSTLEEDEAVSIEAIEARNVVNGLDLIQFAEKKLGTNGEPLYFDDLGLGTVSEAEKNIIVAEINNIRDINDAVADLAFAESIHQIAQGNIDRAAGTLDTYSSGNYPQIPEVVQTPRSGVNITQRVGIHIRANAPVVPGQTPRAMAEPGLNLFLQDILPAMSSVKCYVTFYHNASGSDITNHIVTMADLNLQPIDLLYMVDTNSEQAMTALDDTIVNHVLNSTFPATSGPVQPPRPDADIKISYYKPSGSGDVSIFEIAPLIGHLKAILLRSRPLQPSDVIGSNEADKSLNPNQSLDRGRINAVVNYINPNLVTLNNYITTLETSLGEGGDNDDTIIANIDSTLNSYVNILKILTPTGLPQTGIGFTYQWRKTQMRLLYSKVTDLIKVWDDKEAEYNNQLAEYNLLSDPAERIEKLLQMERVISTVTTLDPGTDPVVFMNDVISVKLAAFLQMRDRDFQNYLHANHPTLSAAITAIAPIITYDLFYFVPTDIAAVKNSCLTFADELLNNAKLLKTDIDKRISKVTSDLLKLSSEADPIVRVKIVQEAGKQLLTEYFKMIPSFDIPAVNYGEFINALDHTDNLLDYQLNKLNNPLPVDDWFYGAARVREKIGRMEQAILMCEGFKAQNIELTPVQFPYKEPYRWFATEFIKTIKKTGDTEDIVLTDEDKAVQKIFLENDHLLYTAWYHEPFNASPIHCGLLVDEWTEIVPTEDETVGIAFHYDKPNSEPPQTMLLAMSPQLFGKGWQWDDLIAILHETLAEAKLRAVEPQQIENDATSFSGIEGVRNTGYANLLPATISTITKYPLSIMLNYAFNNLPLMENISIDDQQI